MSYDIYDLKTILNEMRTYNPMADEHGGKHIIPGWAERIERAVAKINIDLIEGMDVSVDVSTCDADAGHRYFGTVTEISELETSKNGFILLVQDATANFDTTAH